MAKLNKIIQPVLPLRDIVVFPNMIVRLFVGREKSVQALEEVMKENKEILLASQVDATQDEPTEETINKIGVTANVLQILKLPDGAVKILVEGKNRVKIEKFTQNKNFFEAEAIILSDTINKTEEIEALRRSVIDEFDRYAKLNKNIPEEALKAITEADNPSKLADIVAGHLSVSVEKKQEGNVVISDEMPVTETDANLFYQICLLGKRDLHLAPNELVGLQMTILRILAFLPEKPLFQKKKSIEKNSRDHVISGKGDDGMTESSASGGEKSISVDVSSALGKLFRKVDTTTWPHFVKRLGGNGLVKQFLSQSELVSINYAKPSSVCLIKIDSSLLIDSDLVAKVNFYVSDKIGEAVEFKIELIDKVESSLLMIEKDEKEKSINEAYAKISKSEVVNAFVKRFDGKVLRESVKS